MNSTEHPKIQQKIDIQNLLQSEFGKNIQKVVKGFGEAIKNESDVEVIYYDDVWEVCKSALEFMYQEKFDFIYNDNYYGIYMTDKDEWLMKVKNK